MKKIICLLMSALLLLSLAACGGDTGNNGESGSSDSDEPQITIQQYTHEGLYKMTYDSALFKIEQQPDGDKFVYTGDSDTNIYMSIIEYPDMTAAVTLRGILLQNDLEETAYEDYLLGPEKVISYYVSVSSDGTPMCFFIVSHGEGSLLLEVFGYELDLPKPADSPLDLMVQSFIPLDA